MFKTSAILNTDFYKIGHVFQYPKGTTKVYSNLTARDDKHTTCNSSPLYDHKVVFFGLQYVIKYYLQDYFKETFFQQSLEQVLKDYKRRMDNSLGKNSITTDHITALHSLGFLPVRIKALPEGSRVDLQIPLLTITNTVDRFYWVVNFLETSLSAILWKLINNATIAFEYKRILSWYANITCDNSEHLQFQAHDFSFRGMSGLEDASASGMAHLTSFCGTDCIPAIDYVEYYYGANSDKELVGCSIPATEHSVMCAGEIDCELDTFKRLITEVYPSGFISIVSDTWDFWKVITTYAQELKDIILARDGRVVFRPDSGNPVDILCGDSIHKATSLEKALRNAEDIAYDYASDVLNSDRNVCGVDDVQYIYSVDSKYYVINCQIDMMKTYDSEDNDYYIIDEVDVTATELQLDPVKKGAVECLWDIFGGTINSKGYKVLNPKVGLIYGDSITIEVANEVCKKLEAKGFASSNIVFGIGSYTYNYSTRDCFGMAVKSTYVEIKGKALNIQKQPITDSVLKSSAKGLLRVENSGDILSGLSTYILKQECTKEEEKGGELQVVFEDGILVKEISLNEVREKLEAEMCYTFSFIVKS